MIKYPSRIAFKCTREDEELFIDAARLDGRELPDFIRFYLRKSSETILRQNRFLSVFNGSNEFHGTQEEAMNLVLRAQEIISNEKSKSTK